MEKEGLVRGLKFLGENGINIASLTTDRHPATKKYMRTMKPGIKHYFDVWHVSKGMAIGTFSCYIAMHCG